MKVEVDQRGQSGWRFRSIVSLNVFTAEYKPLKGSSYIPLPSCLSSKKAIINMQNEDEECFKWSITRALNSKEIPTLEELRQLAKERGLKRYSKLNKAKLLEQFEIKVLINPQAHTGTPPAADWKRPPCRPRRNWLQQVEEDIGLSVGAAWIAGQDRSMWRTL